MRELAVYLDTEHYPCRYSPKPIDGSLQEPAPFLGFVPVVHHTCLGQREGQEDPHRVEGNEPVCPPIKNDDKNGCQDSQGGNPVGKDQTISEIRQLANLGDRLVFSNGIAALAVLAAILSIIFNGRTHGLIPLYAVGVFLAFTLSQAGMVYHWYKTQERGWLLKAAINGFGAVATGVVLCVEVDSKFTHGAWIIVLLVPALVLLFRSVHSHYLDMREQVSLQEGEVGHWSQLGVAKPHKVVVPISGLNRGSLAALQFSRSLSDDVTAVVVDVDTAATERLRESWKAWGFDIPLVVLESPYRSVVRPLFAYLEETDRREPERGLAVVILPEIVPARWWQNLLHNQTTLLLKAVLLFRQERYSTPRVVINVPYRLQQ